MHGPNDWDERDFSEAADNEDAHFLTDESTDVEPE